MSLEHFIENYGYLAVLIGTFLEGETIVILGGIAAKLGHLTVKGVALAAFIGTTLGDQMFFFIGRYFGKSILRKKPHWHNKLDNVDDLIVKWDVGLILSFRFMYGIRTVASFAFGMSSIPTKKFVILNIIGAAIWAVVMAGAGYLFGHALELLLGNLEQHRFTVFGIVLALAGSVWLFYNYRTRKQPAKAS